MRAIAALLMVVGVWAVSPVLLFLAFFGDHRGGGPDPRDTILVVWLAVSSVVVLAAFVLALGGRRRHPVLLVFTLALGLPWLALSTLGIIRSALPRTGMLLENADMDAVAQLDDLVRYGTHTPS